MPIKIDMPKNLDKLAKEMLDEDFKKNGYPFTCPTCGKGIVVKKNTTKCKYCKTTLKLKTLL